MKKLPTINLKGNDYVLVKDRVLAFHEQYPRGFIETELTFFPSKGMARCKATVTAQIEAVRDSGGLVRRIFTGHSLGPIDEEKSAEKLETVAVGRALAFLGIGIVESIASADEINHFESKSTTPKKTAPKQPQQKQVIDYKDGIRLRWGVKRDGTKWYGTEKDGYKGVNFIEEDEFNKMVAEVTPSEDDLKKALPF